MCKWRVLLNLFVMQCSRQKTNSNLKTLFQLIARKILCLVSVFKILNGPILKNEENNIESQSCLTISQQFFITQTKRAVLLKNKKAQDTLMIENHIGLNIHSLFHSRKLIEQFYCLGIGISNDRVIQLENGMALSLCGQYQANDVVCSTHLRKGFFTVGHRRSLQSSTLHLLAFSRFSTNDTNIYNFFLLVYKKQASKIYLVFKQFNSELFLHTDNNQ